MILKVNASSSYNVIIEKGCSSKIGEYVNKITTSCNVLIVTDSGVPSEYSQKISKNLNKVGYKSIIYTIPSGEASKSIEQYTKILTYMAENYFSRKDLVIAVGGGVVGDLSAFVASTYMRGVKFINVPTTLLSCIDSSVGGKTAINLPIGKNLVGTFFQPKMVIIDTNFLSTLPKEIFLDGLGEAIKYGIMDINVWNLLKGNVCENLEEFIYKCLLIKKDIVEQDEKEAGLRQLLNLGHTFGHAIETLSNYTILHGIAVVKGIVLAAKLSLKNNDINFETYSEIVSVIESYDINYSCDFSLEEIKENILRDKKANNGLVNLIYIMNIGNVIIKPIRVEEIELWI